MSSVIIFKKEKKKSRTSELVETVKPVMLLGDDYSSVGILSFQYKINSRKCMIF